jgi:DNA gyrase subunit A
MAEDERNHSVGKVTTAEIAGEMKKFYLDYAMSVIVSRALPDVRDGLKPVQRRILYAMYQMGLKPTAKFQKSAKVVGETMGKYHPHGDQAIYNALVNLVRDFSMRYPLVHGQGNFGSIDGDPQAAMRYTEVKLTKIAMHLLAGIDKETVPFTDNFDGSLQEPLYLPALLPNLLLKGADGIAVGMATKIPPHNLAEITDALTATIDRPLINKDPRKDQVPDIPAELEELTRKKRDRLSRRLIDQYHFESTITTEELTTFVKGPDFPTAGVIFDREEIIKAYSTGRGKIPLRGVAEIQETKGGKSQIIISELPYQVNKAQLVTKIADLVKRQVISGVTDLRDESSREGIRIIVELSRQARPKSILNNLYKHTNLQTSFPVNMVALIDQTPQTLSLKTILTTYINHRQEIIVRESLFDLERFRLRAHILEGLRIALNNLDAVIETIKKSADAEKAKTNLMQKFGLTQIQAVAILDMQLRRLAALERQKIEDEYQEVSGKISGLETLLKSRQAILKRIKTELAELKKNYGDRRRTKVVNRPLGEIDETDLIPEEETILALTADNYIKRVPAATYRTQHRGGRGVVGMTTKEKDEITHLLTASTHDDILFFTTKGKVYSTKAYEINEGSRRSKGQAIVNLIGIDQDEHVTAILPLGTRARKRNGANYFFFATRKGVVKKTAVNKFQNIRSSGLIAINLGKGDELASVQPTNGANQILLVTHEGKAIRFNEKGVRPMGRGAAGVRGIRLAPKDFVVDLVITSPEAAKDVFVVSENGLGKRVKFSSFPTQNRGGQGVKILKLTKKTGKLAAVAPVDDSIKQVILTSKAAKTIKLPLKNIPRLGRNTQGVILIRMKEGDQIAALTCQAKPEKKG